MSPSRRVKLRFTIAIILTIGVICCKYECSGISSNPYRDKMRDMPFTKFNEAIEKGDIETVYYSIGSPDMYVKFTGGEFAVVANPESYNYKAELLKTGVVVKDMNELRFGEEDDVQLMHVCDLATIAIWVISMLSMLVVTVKKVENTGIKNDPFGNNNSFDFTFDPLAYNGADDTTVENDKNDTVDNKPDNKVKTFKDVAGLAEVKEDIKSLVDFITNKDKYVDAGAKLPKGIILYGPPGTGKTLLAKAIAGEAKVPFIYMSGSDFIEMYVGVGAKRIRELFSKARKQAPCIVFIDEIDSIGNNRSNKSGNSEDRKTINALLTEMDGFKEDDNIIVIGATNRVEDLDPALTRPGRFTDKFCVPLPQTNAERKEVLNIYMRNKRFGDDVILDNLADETKGFSPAQIESWLNEAAIIQVQRDKKYITKEILDDAMSKMLLRGHIKKNQDEKDEQELKSVAYHESGHAILGKIFGSTVSKVTILSSTSGAGGVTFSIPKNTRLLSIKDMEMRVMELYGGRLAELILHNGNRQLVTTGASSDIESATEIIHSMVVSYGMSQDFGMLNLEKAGTDKEYIINKEVEIAKRLEEKALKLLQDNKEALESLAQKLMEKNTVYSADIDSLSIKYSNL